MKLQNQDIKIGKTIDELVEGETFSLSETIKNREILLYLGLTNDDNPLYSQYDYIKELGLTKPVVPTALIFGIITSTINIEIMRYEERVADAIVLVQPPLEELTESE